MSKVTFERAHELLRYEADTGLIFWKVRRNRHVGAGDRAGHVAKDGRVDVGIDGRVYKAHRIIWLMSTGAWPIEVDHCDGVPSNNRWANLRSCTHAQNHQNMARRRALTGSFPVNGRWFSRICVGNRRIYLGCFGTAEEAHAAYLTAKRAHHTFCGELRGG